MSRPVPWRNSARPHVLQLAAALAAGVLSAAPAAAQSLEDGLTIPARSFRSTVEVGRERWDRYWEGTRERSNDNIGTVTTEALTLTTLYGVTNRLTVGVALPYVRTEASQGVLQGQEGWQDVTFGAKLRVLRLRPAGRTTLGVNVGGAVGGPTTRYTPDFLPLSIGYGARRATFRGSAHWQDRTGFFLDGTAGRTWRSTVNLDRPAYFTDDRLTLSSEVAIPDVVDWAGGVGFQNRDWCVPVMLMGQRTLGGGDIRRQDMPFVSNRMDFTRLAARAMYTLPFARGVIVQAGAARTLTGRNVGRSTGFSAGLTLVPHL